MRRYLNPLSISATIVAIFVSIFTFWYFVIRETPRDVRGRESREAVVNEFIAAIETGNLNTIHDLTSPRKEPTLDEVETVLEPLLGRPIEVTSISYITEFGPDTVNVLLAGSSGQEGRAKTPFTYRFYVSRLPGERWHLFITDALQFGE